MKTIALLFAFAFAGCATTPCPTAGRPCPAPATCETACLHGYNLGCTWATPTKQGASCLEVCQNDAKTIPWDVATLTTATSCAP
jgi:hypothetical protein